MSIKIYEAEQLNGTIALPIALEGVLHLMNTYESINSNRLNISGESKGFYASVEKKNSVVGVVVFQEYDEITIWVDLIYIKAKHRAKGIGKRLLEEVKSYAKEHGFKNIELGVHWENYNMVEVMEKSNFKPVGRCYKLDV